MTLAIALAWLQANWKPVLLGLLCFVLGWFLHPKGAAPIAGSAVSTSQSSSASAGAEIKIPCGDKEVIVRYDCKGQNASSVSATALSTDKHSIVNLWVGAAANKEKDLSAAISVSVGPLLISHQNDFKGVWTVSGQYALLSW